MLISFNISKEEERELSFLSEKQGLPIDKIALHLLQEKLHEDFALCNLNTNQDEVIDRRIELINQGKITKIDNVSNHIKELKKKYL